MMGFDRELLFSCIMVGLSIFLVALIVLSFAKQDIDYNTNSLTCEEIRDCILLDIVCMEYNVVNTLGSFEWDVSSSFAYRQKDYYAMECVKVENGVKNE